MFITLNYHISATCRTILKINFRNFAKNFCEENFNIKLAFTSFKIENYFSYKDPIPEDLNSFLIYKFTCVSCSCSYTGETGPHFKTRIEEHIKKIIYTPQQHGLTHIILFL